VCGQPTARIKRQPVLGAPITLMAHSLPATFAQVLSTPPVHVPPAYSLPATPAQGLSTPPVRFVRQARRPNGHRSNTLRSASARKTWLLIANRAPRTDTGYRGPKRRTDGGRRNRELRRTDLWRRLRLRGTTQVARYADNLLLDMQTICSSRNAGQVPFSGP
jgi:hypothetical protein